MRMQTHTSLVAYGTAIASSALAALAAWLLGPAVEPSYLPPFLAAVIVSAWCGGWRAGVLATVLSAAAIAYFHLPPSASFAIPDGNGGARLLLFLSIAALINWLVVQLRTAREQAEARLRQVEGNQQWLESLLDLMPTPLLLIEPDTARVMFANKAASDLDDDTFFTGTSADEGPAASYGADRGGRRIPPDGMPGVRAARGERLHDFEMDWHTPDGKRSLVVSSETLPPMHGHPATVVMPFRDISQLRRIEDELQQRIGLLQGIDQVSSAIAAAQSLESIYELALDCICTTLQTSRAAILLMDGDRVMRFTAWRELSEGYRRHAEGHSPWSPDAKDPQPLLVPDVASDAGLAALRPVITAEGIGALAFVPLAVTGRLIGKFVVYYDTPHAFTATEILAARTIARHVAFAMERVRAEEAVRASEERLRLAARATNDAIWDWDLATDRVEWNEAVFTAFRYSPENAPLDAGWWYGQIHPDDRALVVTGIHTAIAGGDQYWRDEYRFRRGDGSWALIIDRGYVLRDGNGKPLRMIGAMQDITDLKEAEERLRTLNQQLTVATLWAQELAKEAETNERRAAFLSEASSVLVGSLDCTATLQTVARLAVPVLADFAIVDLQEADGSITRVAAHVGGGGPGLEQQLFRSWPNQMGASHPIHQALRTGESVLIAEITDAMLERAAANREHLGLLRELGPKSLLVAPLVARGRTLGALTFAYAGSGRRYTASDVTLAEELARRAALAVDNARLYEESARLHREAEQIAAERSAILEQLPGGIIVFNEQGEAVLVNETARRILGGAVDFSRPVAPQSRLFRDQSAGREELLLPEETPISRALAGATVHAEEFVFRRPDDRRDVWLQVSAVPLRGTGGRVSGGVMVFEDITPRKTLEQLKDEFLSLAAHELKTPLATIKGNSQLLLFRRRRGRLPLPDTDVETLQIINEKADYMGGLINELLDLSRTESGRLALHPERMDLAALLTRLAAQQRQLHPATPFLLEGTEQPVTGNWDRGRLEQVFTNLLDNAVKYSTPGRPVRVRLTVAGDEVQVAVRDEGIGIPEAEQPRIFERHFRGGNAGLSRSGLGLGLFLSRQIVERHGGRIAAESAEGRGSAFTVALPLPGPQSAEGRQTA